MLPSLALLPTPEITPLPAFASPRWPWHTASTDDISDRFFSSIMRTAMTTILLRQRDVLLCPIPNTVRAIFAFPLFLPFQLL